MPSFDIVSKIDLSELKNAVLNSMKEISQRYDFKGSISKIELENEYLVVHTEDDLKAKQVNDILISNLVKRKIDPKSLKEFKKESASGNSIRILFSIIDGIDKDGNVKKIQIYPKKSKAMNIAFDITPAKYVTSLITERGICEASQDGLKKLFK